MFEEMKGYQNIPQKPMTPGIGRVEHPEKIFFFERPDGSTFFCKEPEAWTLYSGKNQVMGKTREILKIIGTSDGRIFHQATIEAQEIFKKEGLEAGQARIKKGQEEELAEAKKHPERPRNFDTIDRDRNPVNLATYGN